jgi:ribosomal protein S27E
MLEVRCPHCNAVVQAADSQAGKMKHCSYCNKIVVMPRDSRADHAEPIAGANESDPPSDAPARDEAPPRGFKMARLLGRLTALLLALAGLEFALMLALMVDRRNVAMAMLGLMLLTVLVALACHVGRARCYDTAEQTVLLREIRRQLAGPGDP